MMRQWASWLVHATLLVSLSTSTTVFNVTKDAENKLSQYDQLADEYLQSLSAAHSNSHHRQKREVTYAQEPALVDDTGAYRFHSITPVSSLCSSSLFMKFIDVKNRTYAICVSATTESAPATVFVGVYEEHRWMPFTYWYVNNPEGLAAFHDNELLYVLIADTDRADGTDLVKINLNSGKHEIDHAVHSRSATSIAIWKMNIDGKFHLALSNSGGNKDSSDFSSEVFFYEWMGTYFDKYSSALAYDVKDVEPFHIHGAAYMAIANFRKSQDNYYVDSEILRYHLDKKAWVSHQKIQTFGAMDWEFFALGTGIGQEFFLVVANHAEYGKSGKISGSMVFKFVKDKFVPFQCLQTSGATSIAALKGEKFLLAIANKFDSVHLYQYDGWRFVPSNIQYTQRAMSAGVNHLTFHHVIVNKTERSILGVSNPVRYAVESSVYELGFKHENVLQQWHDKSTAWCLDTLQNVEYESAATMVEGLSDVVYVDQNEPIVIKGTLYFDQGFEATKLNTPKLQDKSSSKVFDNGVLLNIQELKSKLDNIDQRISSFEGVLKNSLNLFGDQTITGNLTFQDVTFECERWSCRFDNIATNILNGEDVTNWENNLVFLDRDQIINGALFAEKISATEVFVPGLVNGMSTSKFVTKSGNHTIFGQKTFMGAIEAKQLKVSGLVDGVMISPKHVLLTTGHQNVTGKITFSNIDTAWLEVTGLLNGKDLTKFYQDLILSDRPYTITGKKTFNDVVINELSMSPGSTVNGVDLADLWANTLWKNGDQEIRANMTFSSISINGNLKAAQGINGIKIPGDKVVLIDENAVVKAPKIFLKDTGIANFAVNSINGLSMGGPNEPEKLDILLNNGQQFITGHKTFRTIHLDSDSYVKGEVDGVDLSQLKSLSLSRGSQISSNHTWIFNNLSIKGPLTVSGGVSGINLADIYNRSLKLTDSEIPSIIFRDVVYIEDLESDDINGVNVRKDLVLVNEDQVLYGEKRFHDIILEDHSNVLGLINNINVTFLKDTLLRIGNQKITAPKTFEGNLKVKHLTVLGSINETPFNDIAILGEKEEISGPRTFTNVTFEGGVIANFLEVSGLVSGINIDEMISDTLTYDGQQNITGVKTIKGNIFVTENGNLITQNLNNIDVKALWDDAVLVDSFQEISGKKSFDSLVFDSLNASAIDGVTEWDMRYNWMLRDVPQTVYGDVYFTTDLSVQDVNIKGFINGVNLTRLNETIVKTNQFGVVEGPVIFEGDVISQEGITLSGKIQGIDLSEEAVLRSSDVVVAGTKTFLADLVVTGDANVDGLVDGVSISDFCEKTLLLNKDQTATALVIKGDVTLMEGATVGGKFAGINISNFHDSVVTTSDTETFFSGNKFFRNLTIDGPLTVKGKFGGVNLTLLNSSYMSLTRDQEIITPMHFEQIEVKGTLSVNSFNTADSKINNIDLKKLDERLLKTTGSQVVNASYNFTEVVFAEDLFVVGKINDLEVPNSLMRRNRTNYIYNAKIFEEPVKVIGDLKVGHGVTIQGVDLSVWDEKAVKKDGTYEIDGLKIFHNLTLEDVKVVGLIDDVNISENTLLMTYGDQVITGKKRLHDIVEVEGSLIVKGLINDTNLSDLATKTVRRDRNNTITGTKYFLNDLTIQNLEAPSIDGIDVEELHRKVNADIQLDPIQNKVQEIEDAVNAMKIAFDNQAVVYQYYEDFQAFQIQGAHSLLYISGTDSGELLLLSDVTVSDDTCTSIRLFQYDTRRKQFRAFKQKLKSSKLAAMKTLQLWNQTFLFVANEYPNTNCANGIPIVSSPQGYGNVSSDIFVWSNKEFRTYQILRMEIVYDMVAFTSDDLSCLVYAETRDIKVYCADDKTKEFRLREVLRTIVGRKMAILQSGGQTWIAIVTVDLEHPTTQKTVDVYHWNRETRMFSEPIQAIRTIYAQSVLFVKHVDEYAKKLFLIVAEADIPRIHNVPRLLIYRFENHTNSFVKYQEIRDYGQLASISLPTDDVLLFALNFKLGELSIYSYKGVSGFVRVDAISTVGSASIHVFVRNHPDDFGSHYVALAGPKSVDSHVWEDFEFAKILKSKVKGKRLPVVD